MDRSCYFCLADESDLEKHLRADHNIVFGVDILKAVSTLNESEVLELNNFLNILVIDSRPELKAALSDTSDNYNHGEINEETLDELIDLSAQESLTERNEEVFNNSDSISKIKQGAQEKSGSIFDFRCQFCDQTIVGVQSFLEHIKDQKMHAVDIREVLVCPFEECKNVSEHENCDEDIFESPLHCPVDKCNFKPNWNSYYYNNVEDLLRTPSASWKMISTIEDHINSKHSGIDAFTCDKCGKGFKSKMSYKYHSRKHIESIFCDSCNHFFSNSEKYINHNN